MIIHCPECSSRFLVDTELLKKEPKKLRCGQCGNAWIQPPLDAEYNQETYENNEPKEPYFDQSSLPNNVIDGEPKENDTISNKKMLESMSQEDIDSSPKLSKSDISSRRKRAKGKSTKKEKKSFPIFKLFLILIILIVLTGSVLFRGEIIDKINNQEQKQRIAKVFSKIGFPIILKRDQLVFRETKAIAQKAENGKEKILVAIGTVKNISLITGAVPELEIVAINKFGKTLETWKPDVALKTLSPSILTDYSVEIGKLPARTRFLKTVVIEKNAMETVKKEIENFVPEKYHGTIEKIIPIHKSIPKNKNAAQNKDDKIKKSAGAKFIENKYSLLKNKASSLYAKHVKKGKEKSEPKPQITTQKNNANDAVAPKKIPKISETKNKKAETSSNNKFNSKKDEYLTLAKNKYNQAKEKTIALKNKYITKKEDSSKIIDKNTPKNSSPSVTKKVFKKPSSKLENIEKKKAPLSNKDKTFNFLKAKYKTVVLKKDELLHKYVGPKASEKKN